MNQMRLIIFSIIGTGVTSVTTQLITIREFLTQFHGNEITISLSVFCWLLLTGIGSFAAKGVKRSSLKLYSFIILIIAIWPILQLIAIRSLRNVFFAHGVSPGFYPIFFYILATITPYCLLIGFILPYAQKVMHSCRYAFASGELYLTDNIGDIIGGALFSFLLVYLLKPFSIIAVTSTLLILVAILLLSQTRGILLLFSALICASCFYYYAMSGQFEEFTMARQYGQIDQYLESPYGRIVISREGNQHTFWESGTPFYSDANIMTSEEKVHYPLCQLEQVENVLLVSGGLGETMAEISKYNPAHVDYVELDPYLTEAAQRLGVIKDSPNLRIINTDGRSFIKGIERKYDAILIDLPEPDTFQINRFYTSDFFSLTKKILKKDGIMSFSIEYSPNYLSNVWRNKFSTLYNTIKLHFENVIVLPGEEAYFLCRDGKLWTDIPSRLKDKPIVTSYIEGFFYGNVTKERLKQLEEAIHRDVPINTDFEPRLVNIVFQEWFSKYGTSPKYFLFGMAALIFIYLMIINKGEYILFSTGLATMGAEMLIVFAFQVIYGYIYLQIGAIVTAFLLGLLPGAFIGNQRSHKDAFSLGLSEFFILVLLVLFFLWAVYFRSELHPLYFLIYCFLFSFLCGFQFPVVTRIIGEKQSPAAGCLAADLAGASVGTLATGTILIPLWGIRAAVVFLVLVKISSGLTVLFFWKMRE